MLSNAVVENFKKLVEATGMHADIRSTEFKKAAETSRKIFDTPPKNPFSRSERRAASGQMVQATKEVLLKGIGWKK